MGQPLAGLALRLGDLGSHLLGELLAVDLGFNRTAHGGQVEQHVGRNVVERRAALARRIEKPQPEQLVAAGVRGGSGRPSLATCT